MAYAGHCRMSTTQMQHLIDLYRAHRNLWDTSCTMYRHKKLREASLGSIKFNMEATFGITFPITEVKTKIKTLRTLFSREQKRLERLEESGSLADEYSSIPKYEFYHQLDFLKKVITRRNLASKPGQSSTYLQSQADVSASDDSDDEKQHKEDLQDFDDEKQHKQDLQDFDDEKQHKEDLQDFDDEKQHKVDLQDLVRRLGGEPTPVQKGQEFQLIKVKTEKEDSDTEQPADLPTEMVRQDHAALKTEVDSKPSEALGRTESDSKPTEVLGRTEIDGKPSEVLGRTAIDDKHTEVLDKCHLCPDNHGGSKPGARVIEIRQKGTEVQNGQGTSTSVLRTLLQGSQQPSVGGLDGVTQNETKQIAVILTGGEQGTIVLGTGEQGAIVLCGVGQGAIVLGGREQNARVIDGRGLGVQTLSGVGQNTAVLGRTQQRWRAAGRRAKSKKIKGATGQNTEGVGEASETVEDAGVVTEDTVGRVEGNGVNEDVSNVGACDQPVQNTRAAEDAGSDGRRVPGNGVKEREVQRIGDKEQVATGTDANTQNTRSLGGKSKNTKVRGDKPQNTRITGGRLPKTKVTGERSEHIRMLGGNVPTGLNDSRCSDEEQTVTEADKPENDPWHQDDVVFVEEEYEPKRKRKRPEEFEPRRKRKRPDPTDHILKDIASYLERKNAKRVQVGAQLTESLNDPLLAWAKNTTQDLKEIKNPKTRRLLKLQITKLVNDARLKEAEKGAK